MTKKERKQFMLILGTFELLILWVLYNTSSLKPMSAKDIRIELHKHTGKLPDISTTYATISRLKKNGLIEVESRAEAKGAGRPQFLYSLTKSGSYALVDAKNKIMAIGNLEEQPSVLLENEHRLPEALTLAYA